MPNPHGLITGNAYEKRDFFGGLQGQLLNIIDGPRVVEEAPLDADAAELLDIPDEERTITVDCEEVLFLSIYGDANAIGVDITG
jgi:hypothetical protein